MPLARNLRVRQLEHPTDAQIEEITQVLMAAFFDDPGVQIVLNGQHVNTPLYHEFMRVQVLDMKNVGEIWIAEDTEQEDESKRIVGAAGWFPPGVDFLGTEEQREAVGLTKFMESLPDDLRAWWTSTYLPNVMTFAHGWIGETTQKDNWFLLALSVLPSYQGKGAGRALLRARGEHALATGKRAIWTAGLPERVLLYESWGAVIRGAKVLQGMGEKQYISLWILELVK